MRQRAAGMWDLWRCENSIYWDRSSSEQKRVSQGGAQVMDQALLPLIQLLVLPWLGGRRCSCDGAGHDDGHWAYCSPHPGLCSYHKEPLLAWEITPKKGAMKEELLGSLCSGSNGRGWGALRAVHRAGVLPCSFHLRIVMR